MSETEILFCRPESPQAEEDGFEHEEDAALELEIDCHLVAMDYLPAIEPRRRGPRRLRGDLSGTDGCARRPLRARLRYRELAHG